MKQALKAVGLRVAQYPPLRRQPQFLAFGEHARDLVAELLQLGWKGVWVTVDDTSEFRLDHKNLIHVIGDVTPDPHFAQCLDGLWRKGVTVQDIFTQWSGPYDLIAAIHTNRDRMIWNDDRVWASASQWYILGEDGHNEEVVDQAKKRSYRTGVVDDWLVIEHKRLQTTPT